MNTRIVMTASAFVLGSSGVILTFTPDTLLNFLHIGTNDSALLIMQILGALYFAFGMLNWMSKTSLIGGIYNRPVAVANFTHFMIVALALLKVLISHPNSTYFIWSVGIVYFAFAVSYGVILFRHPLAKKVDG